MTMIMMMTLSDQPPPRAADDLRKLREDLVSEETFNGVTHVHCVAASSNLWMTDIREWQCAARG